MISYVNRVLWYVFVMFHLVQVSSCTSFHGEYSDPSAVEILDDRWNETDARVSAERVIAEMVSSSWLESKSRAHVPIVVVGNVTNRTDEHIDTQALVDFISDELINSRKVRMVDQGNREAILKEIEYQQSNVAQGKARQSGKQIGAHYLITGTISSYVQTQERLKTVTYQVSVRATDLQSSEIVWSHKDHIKKRFKRARYSM